MAYTLPFTGDSVSSRLSQAGDIQSMKTTLTQHATSIGGNTTAIGDLQRDVRGISTRVSALELSGGGGGGEGLTIVAMTQSEYNSITPDSNTLYLIY